MQYVFETFHLIKAKVFRMPLLNLIYIIAIFIVCTGYIDYREIYDDGIDSDNEYGGTGDPKISVWWLLTLLSFPLLYFETEYNIFGRFDHIKFFERFHRFAVYVLLISMLIASVLCLFGFMWLVSGCPDRWWK